MNMRTRQPLYETHSISVMRARLRRRSTRRFGLAQFVTFLRAAVVAIRTELAARRAMAQLASMNDHQLRDIGISRCEIESAVRTGRTATKALRGTLLIDVKRPPA